MSYVMAAPDMMTSAATDLAAVGSTLSAAHLAAAAQTVAVIPAAADEVSASIAHVLSKFGQSYQALAGQAAAFHEQFVQHLTAGAGSYAAAEGANVASLQPLIASSGASANAVAASSGTSLQPFVIDLTIFAKDLLLVSTNFFFFLIRSGVPFQLFGVVIFPGF
jgi:hypothetical protein